MKIQETINCQEFFRGGGQILYFGFNIDIKRPIISKELEIIPTINKTILNSIILIYN